MPPSRSMPAATPANSAQRVPGIGDHKSGQDHRRCTLAMALADKSEQALAGDYAEPDAELVKDDQRRGRERQHPEQLVAVLGPRGSSRW